MEAALFANHFRLNNLVAIVDHNHMQSMDFQEIHLKLKILVKSGKHLVGMLLK